MTKIDTSIPRGWHRPSVQEIPISSSSPLSPRETPRRLLQGSWHSPVHNLLEGATAHLFHSRSNALGI